MVFRNLYDCKGLESLDLSYNELDPVLIKNILNVCLSIQRIFLINNLSEKSDFTTNITDYLKVKLNDPNKMLLKCFEIMFDDLSDVFDIKNLLKNRWKNKKIFVKFLTKQVAEFYVI